MSEPASFESLMRRLKAGDNDAAREVFQRFAHRLIALARSRLDSSLRAKVDPEDVLQSVFRSFFLQQAEGRYELADWDSLWSLLVIITLRKCGKKIKYFRAARRSVRQEVPLPAEAEEAAPAWEALAKEPTPAEAVLLADTVEDLLGLLDERERQIISLRLQGYSITDISRQLGRTERTIHRLLAQVRKRLERLRDQEAG